MYGDDEHTKEVTWHKLSEGDSIVCPWDGGVDHVDSLYRPAGLPLRRRLMHARWSPAHTPAAQQRPR